MSTQDIYDDLNAALQDGNIALTWSTVPNLDLTLRAYGIADGETLPMTGAVLTIIRGSVVLTGIAAYRKSSWTATLTGDTLADGMNRFTLSMLGRDEGVAWTFVVSFPNLPESRKADEKYAAVLVPSVLNDLVVQQPSFSVTTPPPQLTADPPAKVRMQGWLVLAGGVLDPYVGYFGSSRLRLDGTVDFAMPASPVLDLSAVAPNADTNLPIVPTSAIGVRLQSEYPDAYALPAPGVMSAALVFADIRIGTTAPIYTSVTAPLLLGDFNWPLNVTFEPPITALTGMNLVLQFFDQPPANSWLFTFPLAESVLRTFGLASVEVGMRPPLNDQSLAVRYASMELQSNKEWSPSVAFITVRDLAVGWTFHWYGDDWFVTGYAGGKIIFFDDPSLPPSSGECDGTRITLLVNAIVPNWILTAENDGVICVPLGSVFQQYFGGSGGLPDNLKITQVYLSAIPQQQTYEGNLMVEGIWSTAINLVTFSLDKIIAQVQVTQSKLFGAMEGWVSLVVEDGGVEVTKATFTASAIYTGDGRWRFAGGLAEGTLSLLDFAFGLLGFAPAFTLPTVNLKELWLTYETSLGDTENPYSAAGTLEALWKPEVLGLTLSATAKAAVARRIKQNTGDEVLARASRRRAAADDVTVIYEGEILGTVKINSLAVTIGLSFADDEEVYLFEVAFGKFFVRAATEWVDDPQTLAGTPGVRTWLTDDTTRHQILVITLGDLSLGEIVEYLVNLANPNLNYHLESPWTFLNSINLSRFELRIDPKLQTIRLTYRIDLNLGFMSIDSVGVLYDRSTGEGTVNWVLTGRFLEKRYDSAKPLTWDAVNDAPPQVPGKGLQLFDLRYLGAGQHITLSGLTNYESVTAVLDALRLEMQPPKNMHSNPLEGSRLRFDPSSQWMFGIDCTVMDTVSLGIVLHDPDLYGLVVSLAGPDAGSLAGLSFELLYKKVTDDVGVFRIRLQVPDAFRQLNFGYVSITLGIITVDIFTNGNFKVDLGFPHDKDFSNSFGLEAGIYIGTGGIYFGLLDGATSSRVPAITNGTFDPVIELGIGLAVGVGRTFNKGPLKAGLYVQMVAIFEGVLGWFHPTDESTPNAMYYWAQGTAGLIGKLYGTVDFKVIKVSVSVEAHAIVTITFAACRETLVELEVGVSVNAEVEILFVSVSFTFELTLSASFTIGKSTTPPWILSADQSNRGTARLMGNVTPARRRRPAEVRATTREAYLLRRFGAEGARARLLSDDGTYDLQWPTNVHVFPDQQVHPVPIKMLPAYTVDQVPVQWPGQGAPAGSSQYRIAFILMADSATSAGATTIAETRKQTAEHTASARDASEVAINVVIDGMLRWSLAATGLDPVNGVVSAGELEELARQLDLPEAETSLDMTTLGDFFELNLQFRISGIPGGTPGQSSGTAFPIPPPLGWDSLQEPLLYERRFETFRPIDATYEREVSELFAKLDPQPAKTQSAGSVSNAGDDVTESMATFIFRDWFLMVAKAAVQGALQVMEAFPYTTTGAAGETLQTISDAFPRVTAPYQKHEGDTVDQVADFFGLAASELLALNPDLPTTLPAAAPGATIAITLGVTPESLAAGNPSWPIIANLDIALGDITHQIAQGETLASIATRFGADVDTWMTSPSLLVQRPLLRDSAPFDVQQSSFVNSGALDLALVAAFFYIRFRGTDDLGIVDTADVPLVEWYVQTIGDLNTIVDGVLPSTVLVPKAFDDLADPISWTKLPGDTIWTVAAMFAVYQNQSGNSEFATWLALVQALNPGSGPFARVILPATATTVMDGETLAAIGERLPIELPDPSHADTWLNRTQSLVLLLEGADILLALTPVLVPDCNVMTATGQTLSTFAGLYDLSLEDLGRRIADIGGLLAAGGDFVVPHPPAAPIGAATATAADLVAAVLADQGSTIAGQLSRFLLSGLRMKAPELGLDGKYHATGPMTGLFELVGQQVVGPPPPETPPPPPGEERLQITVKNYDSANAPWVKLYDSTALTGEEALTPHLRALNPGLVHRTSRRGVVALTSEVDELVFTFTDEDLENNYPATTLSPDFLTAPAARPLYRDVPVRHGLQQEILWQTTHTVTLPNPNDVTPPLNGMPTLWTFSLDLTAAAARYPTKDFGLYTLDPQLGPSAAPVQLALYAWAAAVDIRIRTIPGLPNTYEVFGADTAGRQALLAVWQYLATHGDDSATIDVLFQQSQGAGLPNGLSSFAVDDDLTYIVKTNLSTETHSGTPDALASTADPALSGDFYARLADAQRFLTLVWECSVVGGGGYWFQYTRPDGSPLPQTIFAGDGTAVLSLLIRLASQASGNDPVRRIHPFNDCALVGDSVDASAANFFASLTDLSETAREATVDPGNVAFGTSLRKPPKNTDPIDKQIAIRQLYGMAGYSLVANDVFEDSNDSMPVGPNVPTKPLLDPGASVDETIWDLFQVIPIHRYAKTYGLPEVDALPAPDADPYAGINGASSGGTYRMANTQVSIDFREVFGNASLDSGTLAEGGPDGIDVDVGYTDPVIGVGAWPAVTGFFDVAPAGSGALLTTTIAMQASTHLPANLQRASDAAAVAADQHSRFHNIYYQITQPDVTVSLLTTLDVVSGRPAAMTTNGSLLGFVAGACAWLSTASSLENVFVDTAAAPTLADVSTRYGVGYDGLAAANPAVPLSHIFVPPPSQPVPGTDFTIPIFAVFKAGGTTADVCPAGVDPVDVLEDDENTSLPLHTGTELVIPTHAFAIVDPPPPELPPSLETIADTNHVTLAGLVTANETKGALLRIGFVFFCEGVEVEVSEEYPDVSLDDIAATFQSQGIQFDAVMVASANALLPGMFRDGATLDVDRYIVESGETLADNGSGSTVGVLAPLNTHVADLFFAGTALYVQSDAGNDVFGLPLDDMATTYAISPQQLLRHNRNVTLTAPQTGGEWLAIPGHAALPSAAAALRIPYTIPANAELDDLAALFLGGDATALAQANLNLPGIIAGGKTITCQNQNVPTYDGDSFATVLARFDPAISLSQLVGCIGGAPGYLATGALLLAPPAVLPTGTAFTPSAVAAMYGISVSDLAVANSGLDGLVMEGISLDSPNSLDGQPTITTGAADTFNSLVWRFSQELVETSVVDVIAKNKDIAFLAPGADMLLAPTAAVLSAPFGNTLAGWRFPGPIFDVQAWIEISRNATLVDPAFRGTTADPGSAVRDRASLPPVPKTGGQGRDTLALQSFARNLKDAVPPLRAATGKVYDENQGRSPSDVFAVAFGTGYIASVDIEPGVTVGQDTMPQYFALRPLENTLATRNAVGLRPLLPDGTLGTAVPTDLQGIDLESWAQRFLGDVDLFLSAPYAASVYQTSKRDQLEVVLAQKSILAAGIAAGLDYTLDLGQGDPSTQNPAPPDWSSAVEELRQMLLVSLAAGYGVDAVVQYQSTVSSPWTTDVTRLSGPGQLSDQGGGGQLRTSITTAKTSLATTAAGSPSYVNFLVSVSQEGVERSLDLALQYCINEVELNVTEVVEGYDASDWISFILPFTDDLPSGVTIDVGEPAVPLPVRAYPPLPALLGQTATPTHPSPASYDDAMHWDYAFTYQHQSMAVDQMRLAVELNQAPLVALRADPMTDDLFGTLAQYDAVAPQLWDILKGLTDLSKVTDRTQLDNAIATFATLVTNVATQWSAYWSTDDAPLAVRSASENGPMPELYELAQTLDAVFDDVDRKWYYTHLYLKRGRTYGDLDWPVMGVFVPGGQVQSMGAGVDTPEGRRYDFPPKIEAFTLLGYEMRFAALHVATYQNAASQVQVLRNEQLSSLAPTNPAFVYQTLTLAFPNVVTPLLAWSTSFPIGIWTDVVATNPLGPVFDDMFDGSTANRTITCGIRYGYELASSPGASIVPYLPVKYRPKFPYDADPTEGTIQQIITVVDDWRSNNDPVETGGEWSFVLSLYSSVDGQIDRPLLELPVYSTIA